MNVCSFVGNLTKDAVRISNKENSPVAFEMAVEGTEYKKMDQKVVDFPEIKAFDHIGDYVLKYGKKGKRIEVLARYKTSSKVDENGKKAYYKGFVAKSVHINRRSSSSENYDTDAAKDINTDQTQLPKPNVEPDQTKLPDLDLSGLFDETDDIA